MDNTVGILFFTAFTGIIAASIITGINTAEALIIGAIIGDICGLL